MPQALPISSLIYEPNTVLLRVKIRTILKYSPLCYYFHPLTPQQSPSHPVLLPSTLATQFRPRGLLSTAVNMPVCVPFRLNFKPLITMATRHTDALVLRILTGSEADIGINTFLRFFFSWDQYFCAYVRRARARTHTSNFPKLANLRYNIFYIFLSQRFESSGMWHSVLGWEISDVSKDRVTFISKCNHRTRPWR